MSTSSLTIPYTGHYISPPLLSVLGGVGEWAILSDLLPVVSTHHLGELELAVQYMCQRHGLSALASRTSILAHVFLLSQHPKSLII